MPKKQGTRTSDPGAFLQESTFECNVYKARISTITCSHLRCRGYLEGPRLCSDCDRYKKPKKKELAEYRSKSADRQRVMYGTKLRRKAAPTTDRNKEFGIRDGIEDFLSGATDNLNLCP